MSEAVTVSGGTPTLTLNDGGTATYTGGSGTSALTFSYTVLAGQNTPDLMVTAFNLNGATVLDGAGNAANVSLTGVSQGSPVIDTTTPAAPVITNESIVNTNQVSLTGTALDQGNAEAADLIRVYDGTTLLGTTTTNATGGWTYTTASLSVGTHALTATVTDLAGNTSVASQAVNPVIAPPAPAIASFSPHTGSVAGVIDANVLTLTGTAAASSTVTLYDGTTPLGTATADGSGNWSFTTATLVDGTHSFTATDTVSGATSTDSAALAVTVDTVAPAAPVITSDTVLNTNQVALTGTALDQGVAEAGDIIKVYDGTTLLGTTTTDATGAWTYTTAPLSNGTHVLTAIVTDLAGNTSVASQAVDPVAAPPAPAIASFSPHTGSVAGVADANVLTLTGTAAASSTVTLCDGTTPLGTATADGSGNWTFTTATLVDGTHNFTATDTVSGATSAASAALAVSVDTVAPAAPVITSDTIVNTNQVTVTGSALDQGIAEAGDLVKVCDGTTLLGTTTTNATGAWSYTTAPLSDGTHVLTATVTDVAGNTSVASQAVDPTIAPPAPPAPAIAAFSPDTGSVADVTDANVLTLAGTAEANTTVSIYDGSTLLGTTTTNGIGAWSFTTAKLSDGTHNFTATDTDASAITSVASSALNVTVDTVAPTVMFTSDVKNSNGSFTVTGTALDKGTVEAGETIKIYDGTTYLGSTTVDSNGQWSFTTAALSKNEHRSHALIATVTDLAGNTSVASQAVNPVIAPPAPAIASFSPHIGSVAGVTDANVLTLTGTAAASSTVTLYDGTTPLGTATADGSGNWTFTTATLVDGTHNLTATDTVSGATSAASAALAVSVDTVAPAAPVITSDAIVNTDQVTVTGSALDQGIAEADDLVKVYDGTTLLGTTTTNATGTWNYTTAPLSAGTHALTATVTDVAGNTSVVSQAVDPTIAPPAPPAPPAPAIAAFSPDTGSVAGVTDANVLTLTGTAEANTTVSIYDGSTLLGTTTVNGSDAWSFTTASSMMAPQFHGDRYRCGGRNEYRLVRLQRDGGYSCADRQLYKRCQEFEWFVHVVRHRTRQRDGW